MLAQIGPKFGFSIALQPIDSVHSGLSSAKSGPLLVYTLQTPHVLLTTLQTQNLLLLDFIRLLHSLDLPHLPDHQNPTPIDFPHVHSHCQSL